MPDQYPNPQCPDTGDSEDNAGALYRKERARKEAVCTVRIPEDLYVEVTLALANRKIGLTIYSAILERLLEESFDFSKGLKGLKARI